jgi:hypothetical protein
MHHFVQDDPYPLKYVIQDIMKGADGGNVGTDIISPQEEASDDKSDEPPVLPSNPPPNGKILMY